jgi:hypothetical protein
LDWVEAAVERWQDRVTAGRPDLEDWYILGVDDARSGSDFTVFVHRRSLLVPELVAYDAPPGRAVGPHGMFQ